MIHTQYLLVKTPSVAFMCSFGISEKNLFSRVIKRKHYFYMAVLSIISLSIFVYLLVSFLNTTLNVLLKMMASQ